jgi:glycosyltransferase involved in cell wall biosynthesis
MKICIMRSRGDMAKKRIMFLLNAVIVGGANTLFLRFVDNWDKAKYEAYVVLPMKGPMCSELKSRGISYSIIGKHMYLDRGTFIFFIFKSLRVMYLVMVKKIALIWANCPLSFLYAGPAAIGCGRPSICYFHIAPSEYDMKSCFVDRATALIACSDSIKKQALDLITWPADAAKIVTIHNFVDTKAFFPADNRKTAKDRLGIPDGSMVLTLNGHISKIKGQGVFLDMFDMLVKKGYPLFGIFAGEDKDPGKVNEKEVKEKISRMGLESRIRMTGFVKDVLPILQATDILVLPSLQEGMPVVVLEAMACGLPVVATAVDGTPEAVRDGLTGFLTPPGDAAALACAVEKLLLDPKMAKDMGCAGRKMAQENFSISIYTGKAEGLIDGLVSGVKKEGRIGTADKQKV